MLTTRNEQHDPDQEEYVINYSTQNILLCNYLLKIVKCIVRGVDRVLIKKIITLSASQDIPYLLGNLKVHYHVHKSLSLAPIMSQMNPVCEFIFFPRQA
jgi:hypothetical protein